MSENESLNDVPPKAKSAQDGRQPPPPPERTAGYPPLTVYAQPPRRRFGVLRAFLLIIVVLVLFGSISLNMLLLGSLGAGLEAGGLRRSVLRPGEPSQTVAVYEVNGIIAEPASRQFGQFFESVRKDAEVKAVLLRVDSPGGAVTSSDQICEMVKRLKAAGKKVVVSMGSMAASGGYYISAPADEIYAEPTSITGSIGVIAGWVVLKGTLDKIGAEPVVIKSSNADRWKDSMSMLHAPQPYQLQHVRDILDQMQGRFEAVVKDGRRGRLKIQEVPYTVPATQPGGQAQQGTETVPFNGKIYLPEEAKDLGLIDAIGYRAAAIDRAASLAGLTKPNVVVYSRRKGLAEVLLGGQAGGGVKLDLELIDRLQTPRFMMLWQAQ